MVRWKPSRILLSLRNCVALKRVFLPTLFANNLERDEIAGYTFIDGNPTVRCSDGTTLSFPPSSSSWGRDIRGVPASHIEAVEAYILRYKFPHAMPQLRIDTGMHPRRLFPVCLHRQHLNTLHDLPREQRAAFSNALALRSGDRVLEVGSYVGFGTVRIGRQVGPAGHVLSVEANEAAFGLLRRNVAQNGLSNVTCRNRAVDDRDEDNVRFYEGGRQANSLLADLVEASSISTVTCRRIPSLLEEQQFTPDFMILTINGAELRALEACRDVLRGPQRMRIVTPGWYSDRNGRLGPRIVSLLRDLGFCVAHTRGRNIFAYRS